MPKSREIIKAITRGALCLAMGMGFLLCGIFNAYAESTIPEHHKSIERLDGDVHRITLDVTGGQMITTEKHKVDVLLVLDVSWSMMSGSGGSSRPKIQALKQTLTASGGLVDALMDNEALDARIATATFNGRKDVSSTTGYLLPGAQKYDDSRIISSWNNDSEDIKSGINSIVLERENGNTNYQAAFMITDEAFATARPDAEKILIVLGDGEPNAYYRSDGYTVIEHNMSIEKTYEAFNAMGNPDAFYLIGYDVAENQVPFSELPSLAEAKGIAKHERYIAENDDELARAFAEIAEDIIPLNCKEVVIEDTLSEYVNLTDASSISVVKTGPDGTTETLDASIVQTSYDEASRTVKAVFEPEYELEPGWTYALSFNVEPSEQAYSEYISTGYPEGGFPSNDGATLTYTYEDSETVIYYEEPKFKFEEREILVRKAWRNIAGVQGSLPEVSLDLYLGGSSSAAKSTVLTEDDGFRGKFSEVPVNIPFEIREREIDGYECVGIANEGSEDAPSYVITNTRLPSLTIENEVRGEYADKDKHFDIEIRLTDKNGDSITGEYVCIVNGVEKTLEFDADGKAVISLKDGDKASVERLPLGTSYAVSVTPETGAGYTSEYEEAASGVLNEDRGVKVINTAKNIIPSGVTRSGPGHTALVAATLAILMTLTIHLGHRARRRGDV